MTKRWFQLAVMTAALVVTGSATGSGQTLATARVMREKLTRSQQILAAIMTSDFAALERETAALVRLTESQRWSALRTPEYLTQSSAFVRAATDLAAAARRHDLDAAATQFTVLTGKCFDCHRYVKSQRIAGGR
jgi:hypothetical protein